MSGTRFTQCLFVLFMFLASYASAEQGLRWRDNLRSNIDTAVVNQRVNGDNHWVTFWGLDLHTVLVKDQRDWATIMFQPYYRMAVNTDDFPDLSSDSKKLTWRIANANFHVTSNNALNIKVGHFEIPFGIEFYEDTNGTLRQFSPVVYQQLKVDWGVSINGELSNVLPHDGLWGLNTYEIALTRGSGNMWESGRADRTPYAFSGRVGRTVNSNSPLGFSWMLANTLNDPDGAMDSTTERRQFGVDGGHFQGLWGALWELGIGDRKLNGNRLNEQQFGYVFGEVNRSNRHENLLAYAQWFGDWTKVEQLDATTGGSVTSEQERHRINLGVRYLAHRDMTLSTQLSYWLAGSPMDDRFRSDLLFRIRW